MRPIAVFLTSVIVATVTATMVVGAPWLATHGYPVVAAVIYQVFSPLCHQVPSRSFHLDGAPFAVCARCTGVYFGAAIGLLVYPIGRRIDAGKMPSRRILLAGLAPLVVDGLAGVMKIYSSPIGVRAATGILAGAIMAWFILPGLVSVVSECGGRGLSSPST